MLNRTDGSLPASTSWFAPRSKSFLWSNCLARTIQLAQMSHTSHCAHPSLPSHPTPSLSRWHFLSQTTVFCSLTCSLFSPAPVTSSVKVFFLNTFSFHFLGTDNHHSLIFWSLKYPLTGPMPLVHSLSTSHSPSPLHFNSFPSITTLITDFTFLIE